MNEPLAALPCVTFGHGPLEGSARCNACDIWLCAACWCLHRCGHSARDLETCTHPDHQEQRASVAVHALTDHEISIYKDMVLDHGRARLANFGRDFKEDDFLVGAMIAFEAFGAWGKVPASWVVGLMSGTSPLTGKREEMVKVSCSNLRCRSEQEYAYEGKAPDDWITLTLNRDRPRYYCSRRCTRLATAHLDD